MFRSAIRRPFRNTAYLLGGVAGAAYGYDTFVGDGISNRVARTLSTLLLISLDYKVNFDENHDINRLHERNAERMYNMVVANKGMYIKIGQMIAIQGYMFPRQYQEKFKLMFDRAPEQPWAVSDETLRQELGPQYRELFERLDEKPIASASIAQVHQGVLKKNHQKVAVKIQKRSVTQQVDADLFTYKVAMRFYQWVFDMPLETVADYVARKTREELDFRRELHNAARISSLVNADRQFAGKVYIPEYYSDISTGRVLIGEWIDGDSIGEYSGLKDKGYNTTQLVDTIVRVYSKQVFQWGFVHCDLHPGNLMVRHLPDKSQQLVILDHGLYEVFSDKFKREHSEFWKYSMERNIPKLREVLTKWGIDADDMMMAVSGLDPNKKRMMEQINKIMAMSYYDRQVLMRERMRRFLQNTDLFPLSLTYLMRSMRIVQGLNRNFGSPVNRVGILLADANRTIRYTAPASFHEYVRQIERTTTYILVRVITAVLFQWNRIQKFVSGRLFHHKVVDLEEQYENDLKRTGEGMGFDEIETSDQLLQ